MRTDEPPALWLILFLISFLILVESTTDIELEFLSEPTSRLVKPSDGRAVFRCNVSPTSAEVRWLWRGQPVVQNKWIKVSRHKLTVHLGKMEKKSRSPYNLENGFFQCEARLKGKVLVSAPAKLIIAVLEPFLPQSDVHISVIRGNTAVIPCTPPHSVPTVVTEFQLNGTLIDKTTSDQQLMPSGDLQIFDAKPSDSGEYVCGAFNPYLLEKIEAKHKVILSVIDSSEPKPPSFVVHPLPKTSAVLGSNISLECAVNGFPVPTVTWRRHHGQLPKWRFNQTGGNLSLFGIRRGDEGTYYCEADNSVGDPISKGTEVHVQETPQITKAPRDMDVEAGQNLTLHCIARGHPKPVVTWIHNGRTLVSEHGKGSQLVLHDVNHKHTGIYQCFANNELGSTYAACLVTVTSDNQTIDADYDNDYEDYDGDTGPGSQMFHHGKDINLLPKGHPQNPSEYESDKVNNSESDGDAINKRRKKKKSKGVKLVPPSRPDITRLSDTSVMVRWGVPRNDGLPILFFKVQYREIGRRNSHWMTIDEDIAAHIHSYAVTDLRTGGKYRFRIAAVYSNNDNKLGPNSDKFILYKDPPMKKPDFVPEIIHAEAASPSAITLQWEYKDLDSVPIEGFFIYYRTTHSAGDYLKITVPGANMRSHIISHLLPDTSYDIKIQCFNIAGASEFSNIYTCKTKPSEALGPRSRSSKPNHSEEEEVVGTKPVSSKNSDGNLILYIVLGVICTVMLIASSIFIALCIRQRQNRHPNPDGHNSRQLPLKATNGHISSNGYIAVRDKVNINVNPLSHLDSDDSDKADQFDDVVSNNNEIIRMQTFSQNVEQQEPLLIQETTAGSAAANEENRDQETEPVSVPNDCDTSAEVPRSI